MAERNKLMRALGCHYSGNSGRTEHVTFLCIALDDEIESFLSHDNPALGNGLTLSCGFFGYIDHTRLSPRTKMRELQPAHLPPTLLPPTGVAIARCGRALPPRRHVAAGDFLPPERWKFHGWRDVQRQSARRS